MALRLAPCLPGRRGPRFPTRPRPVAESKAGGLEDERRVRTKHAELSLEEIAALLPGTGEVMASVGRCYASCWHAAHGGNWDLAAYFLRRTRSLLRGLAVSRPKYREQLQHFDAEALAPLAQVLGRRDLQGFDIAYEAGVQKANEYHVETGKPYVRWRRPENPPGDLDLGPG